MKETKPDLVLVVDALAARSTKRLNRTFQISDAGIYPVSYTHLDVYKRQALGSMAEIGAGDVDCVDLV